MIIIGNMKSSLQIYEKYEYVNRKAIFHPHEWEGRIIKDIYNFVLFDRHLYLHQKYIVLNSV